METIWCHFIHLLTRQTQEDRNDLKFFFSIRLTIDFVTLESMKELEMTTTTQAFVGEQFEWPMDSCLNHMRNNFKWISNNNGQNNHNAFTMRQITNDNSTLKWIKMENPNEIDNFFFIFCLLGRNNNHAVGF